MAHSTELEPQHRGKSKAQLEDELAEKQKQLSAVLMRAVFNPTGDDADRYKSEIKSLHKAIAWHENNGRIGGLGEIYRGDN